MTQSVYQKSNHLAIRSANCLNTISPLAQCSTCQQICPQQALQLRDGQWHAGHCSLCGLCTVVCPTQVFQIDQPSLLQYESKPPLQLCCSQNPAAPAQALRLNCLQQLPPLALFHLLYQHQQLILYLTPDLCQQCSHHWYAQGLLQQLEPYQIPAEKLQIIIQTPQPATEPETPTTGPSQRRALFRDLWQRTEQQSQKAVVQAAETVAAVFSSTELTATEPQIFPARLPLYALYVKKELPLPAQTQLPFRQMVCTACHFCGACARLCPTQALKLTETEQQKQLLFCPELCIGCNLCQQICMQHGLQWDDWMTGRQFMQTPQCLAHSPEKICSCCQHSFYQWPPGKNTVCSFCQRENHESGCP